MATRASIGARHSIASQSIDQSIQSIAAGLKLDVPDDPPAQVNRDPDLRVAAQQERIASFLAVVASKVGKPVKETEVPLGAADPNAVPPPAENEPPHTQTVEPLARPGEAVEESDEEDELDGAGEPTFAGKPLSAFDGLDDDAILAVEHVGPKTLKSIRRAQKRRDAKGG